MKLMQKKFDGAKSTAIIHRSFWDDSNKTPNEKADLEPRLDTEDFTPSELEFVKRIKKKAYESTLA
jgi:hypothetical protein